MIIAYCNEQGVTKLYCDTCTDHNLVDLEGFEPCHTHSMAGRKVICDFCGNAHNLATVKRNNSDKKVALGLSIPASLKDKIDRKCKMLNMSKTAYLMSLIGPILEKEFPDEVVGSV